MAAVAFFISFSLYAYTAAPSVTLLDSGEFITAAQHFGVAHPTGYPLWTLGAWLFSHLPFTSPAWEVNLFSGLLGALAVGVEALLINNFANWIGPQLKPPLESNPGNSRLTPPLISLALSLTFALSVPMWSQAVIAEVYTLHALLGLLWIASLYQWVRQPNQLGWFVISFFFYALSLSNHHLALAWAPVPLFLLLLLRRELFIEFFLYLASIAALFFWGFASISDDPQTPLVDHPVLQVSVLRLWLCVGVGWFIFFVSGRRLFQGKWGVGLLVALTLGFLPYFYMPLASATNPPMNWGYARTQAGFFYSLDRSQYEGSLSTRLENTLGKFLGATPAATQKVERHREESTQVQRFKNLFLFSGLYWAKLSESFHLPSLLLFLGAWVSLLFLRRKERAWLFGLFVAFLLSAFLEPLMDCVSIDAQSWRVQCPYQTFSYALFTLIAALALIVWTWLFSRLGSWILRCQGDFLRFGQALLLCLLPFFSWVINEPACSQRDHWFGWMFGHDILKNLPKNSVFFGGTDPGRFVPTYMIFGESVLPAPQKRDPSFDRRDLYIITQNALGDLFYLKYIRDQYTDQRPPVHGWFERWLRRDAIYPKDVLILPTDQEVVEIVDSLRAQKLPVEADPILLHSAVAEWIFQKNKAHHTFFIEESFPMSWSYPYAIPHGLCYELASEPLAQLPPQAVEEDQVFWSHYIQRLLLDPHFAHDVDAQKSFCKLRLAAGRIYQFRGLLGAAESVYKQALQLYPADEEASGLYIAFLMDQGRFSEALGLAKKLETQDPYNAAFIQTHLLVQQRLDHVQAIARLSQELAQNASNADALQALVQEHVSAREFVAAENVLETALKQKPKDAAPYLLALDYYSQLSRFVDALRVAKLWSQVQPNEPQAQLMLARMFFLNREIQAFYKSARQAIKLGGLEARQRLALDPLLEPMRQEPAFGEMLQSQNEPKPQEK